ncbi:MAG: DNA repair protein RecO [Cyanothece sp. SIO2G6]|nr:DNA repair protein RecO [Cyanothece sp. SIO2G6]
MSVSIPGKSYKATGITLKSSPMGESDRLLTILTKEHGVVRVVTPGCRKPKSSLRAISSAFVMGELLIIKGRNLDKLVQADCRGSFPALSRDLGKLTAAQYLAELVLSQALSQQPQEELFTRFQQHLAELSQRPPHQTLPYLVYSIFTLLVSAGVAPQLQHCGLSRKPLIPDLTNAEQQVEFDIVAGQAMQSPQANVNPTVNPAPANPSSSPAPMSVSEPPGIYGANRANSVNPANSANPALRSHLTRGTQFPQPILLTSLQLWVLQQLAHLSGAMLDSTQDNTPNNAALLWFSLDDLLDAHLISLEYLQEHVMGAIAPQVSPEPPYSAISSESSENDRANETDETDDASVSDNFADEIFPLNRNLWLALERLLRQYCHYHFDQPIRSAALIETCFPETMD